MSKSKKVGPYIITRTLGEGSFGKVKLGIHTETQARVAIKILKKEKMIKGKLVEQIKREITVMRIIHHQNVVNLIDVMSSPEKLYIVLELVLGGELFWLLVREGKFEDAAARKYFQQLIDGVEYCHEQGVCHRDLKPENLLLDEKGNLKISDFGLSALHTDGKGKKLLNTQCGTVHYVAPEVLDEKPYDGPAADIWSCGVILFVLLSGVLPFDEPIESDLFKKIRSVDYKFPDFFGSDVKDLLSKILVGDPKKRYTAVEIKNHAWFQVGYKKSDTKLVSIDISTVVPMQFTKVEESPKDEKEKQPSKLGKDEKGINGEVIKMTNTNAFDLINLSGTLDMTRMLRRMDSQDFITKSFTRFTSKEEPQVIIENLVTVLKSLKIEHTIVKNEWKIKCVAKGSLGVLTFRIEITRVAQSLYFVNFLRGRGGILDFWRLYNEIVEASKRIIHSRLKSSSNIHLPKTPPSAPRRNHNRTGEFLEFPSAASGSQLAGLSSPPKCPPPIPPTEQQTPNEPSLVIPMIQLNQDPLSAEEQSESHSIK